MLDPDERGGEARRSELFYHVTELRESEAEAALINESERAVQSKFGERVEVSDGQRRRRVHNRRVVSEALGERGQLRGEVIQEADRSPRALTR